jgi:hypothetical protein
LQSPAETRGLGLAKKDSDLIHLPGSSGKLKARRASSVGRLVAPTNIPFTLLRRPRIVPRPGRGSMVSKALNPVSCAALCGWFTSGMLGPGQAVWLTWSGRVPRLGESLVVA